VRGLSQLLDADERLLAAVERPAGETSGLSLFGWRPGRERRDGRAALLLLTDRQLIWLVDHFAPDRYLLDWGVDAELICLEALVDARLAQQASAESVGGAVLLSVETRGGISRFRLPRELLSETDALLARLRGFLPSDSAIRRRYAIAAEPLDVAPYEPYRQADEARAALDSLAGSIAEPTLAELYAPRREGVRQPTALVLTACEVIQASGEQRSRVPLVDLRSIGATLSPLVGRMTVRGPVTEIQVTYPAPLAAVGGAFIRALRRAWANR
jgi:hypothetical protein